MDKTVGGLKRQNEIVVVGMEGVNHATYEDTKLTNTKKNRLGRTGSCSLCGMGRG